MLNIILGNKDSEKFLAQHKFVDYNDGLFDDEYTEEWFNDKFIQKILNEIDHIDLSKSTGTAFKNFITGNTHSQIELSTGCKTLILMYKYPDVIFQARFGDNCTDLVEQIATKNNITLKSDYLHSFNFKYIKEINYINYGLTAHNKEDIFELTQQFRNDNMDVFDNRLDYIDDTIEGLWKKHPHFMADISKAL